MDSKRRGLPPSGHHPLEHDKVLGKVIVDYESDHTELYKQFFENLNFKKWLAHTVFGITYEKSVSEAMTGQ